MLPRTIREVLRVATDNQRTGRAFAQVDQPWGDAELAPLYDAFPFEEDLPLYLELAGTEGGRVLELGCGTGRLSLPLLAAGHQVTGIDASPAMLSILRRKLEAAGPDVHARATLLQADMRDFRLEARFDLAIVPVKSFAYLLERADQQRALSAILAHLRPGGLLAMDLLHPSPAWLMEPPGSVRQDLAGHVPEANATVVRTETAVSTDLAAQVRVIRSAYEVIDSGGGVRKRIVEWPYRYLYRFEAELLLERAGFRIEALYGGYRREPFTSDSRLMLFLARRP
jgi:SAM-dependent methyltransferase